MPRRSEVKMLVDVLSAAPNEQLSRAKIGMALGWSIDKVDRVIQRACADSTQAISIGSGGVIRFRGSERGKDGSYNDVARVIERHWGPNQGFRDISVLNTARAGRRGLGVWTHPDLVMQAFPRRKRHRDDLRDLHAIEVEIYKGFDIRSVYQAHAQGRGADFSWVFFATAPSVNPPLDRILWAAEELGIGMVEFDRAAASTTYKLHLPAVRRDHWTEEEREGFRATVGPLDS